MARVLIVPVSHVSHESIKRIEKALAAKPDCVAIELDIERYHAMKTKERIQFFQAVRTLGFSSAVLYIILYKLQQYLGKATGILPGEEMLFAVDRAAESGLYVALIDIPVSSLLRRLGSLSFKEKLRVIRIAFLSLIGMFIPIGGERVDVTKIPDDKTIEKAMNYLKRNLPSFYSILVEERDKHMASNLQKLSDRFERIVSIVGAAHAKGISRKLSKSGINVSIVR